MTDQKEEMEPKTIQDVATFEGLKLAVVIARGLAGSRLISLSEDEHKHLEQAYLFVGTPPIGLHGNQNK